MKHLVDNEGVTVIANYVNNRDNQIIKMLAPQYNPTHSYVVDDLVIYDNVLYKCTSATTGAFDKTKWTQTTISNAIISQITDAIQGAY